MRVHLKNLHLEGSLGNVHYSHLPDPLPLLVRLHDPLLKFLARATLDLFHQLRHQILPSGGLPFSKVRWDYALDLYVLHAALHPELPAEDDELPRDVHPVEVIARVRLREPFVKGVLESISEGGAALHRTGEESNSTREDAFNGLNLVPGVAQIPDRVEQGKGRSHRALRSPLRPCRYGCYARPLEAVVGASPHRLGGGNDLDALAEPVLVLASNLITVGEVDDDSCGIDVVRHQRSDLVHVKLLPLRHHLLSMVGVHAPLLVHHLLGVSRNNEAGPKISQV
mmetsp:Transcript_20225/g.46610  ORF Transcript_20225/g.46610 Transcript_20225/m.46610 type:complete len:282 (-) Transcript_20225:1981-2826(-)